MLPSPLSPSLVHPTPTRTCKDDSEPQPDTTHHMIQPPNMSSAQAYDSPSDVIAGQDALYGMWNVSWLESAVDF